MNPNDLVTDLAVASQQTADPRDKDLFRRAAWEIDRLRAVVEFVWDKCIVVHFPGDGAYPIEHNALACKYNRKAIEAAARAARKDGVK